MARGEAGIASDVDLLVDLADGATLFDLAAMRAELEGLLGVAVDVVPLAGLEGTARERVLAEALALRPMDCHRPTGHDSSTCSMRSPGSGATSRSDETRSTTT